MVLLKACTGSRQFADAACERNYAVSEHHHYMNDQGISCRYTLASVGNIRPFGEQPFDNFHIITAGPLPNVGGASWVEAASGIHYNIYVSGKIHWKALI